MADLCDLGVTGLGTMGANLARNAARKGFKVAVHNRHDDRTKALIADHGAEGAFTPSTDLAGLAASVAVPRVVLIMVAAGKAVDAVIADLLPHLEPGDIVVDGGNSLYTDTRRRSADLEKRGFHFIGMGVSGGEVGALEGPSMMPGGPRDAYERVRPIFETMSAHVDGVPCCTYLGPDGAGHYVKMVHNGIEYADMQLIAESYDLMKTAYGMTAPAMAEVFEGWRSSDLGSYLVDITAEVLAKADPDTGAPLVDVIADEAEQKGTGRWTAVSALELGVPITAISEAVDARIVSSKRGQRATSARLFPPAALAAEPPAPEALDELRDALYAAKIVAYAQGFEQLAAASKEFGWKLDLAAIATIWRGGCIIRAGFLDKIKAAYERAPDDASLLTVPYFADGLKRNDAAFRKTVALAVASGVPVPAASSTLAYFDGMRRERGPANLLQGLRDYFGSHTYHRTDKDGVFHVEWSQGGKQIESTDH